MKSRKSISRLKTFQRCPRQYRFQYVDKLPEKPESKVRLNVGSLIHDVLESIGKAVQDNQRAGYDVGSEEWAKLRVTAHEQARKLAQETYDLYGCDADVFSGIDAGLRALETLTEEGHKILECETAGIMEFGDWEMPYRVDIVTELDGLLYVLDYKTKGKLPQNTSDRIDPQTAGYGWAMMQKYNRDEVVCGRIYLTAKPANIKLKKDGELSLQSVASWDHYQDWIAKHPEHAIDPEKAAEKFKNWFRIDQDYLDRDKAGAILAETEKLAVFVGQTNFFPPHFDPVRCGWCQYQMQCDQLTLFGKVQETALVTDIEE